MRHLVEAEAEKGEQLKNFVFIIDEIMTIDEAHHDEKILKVCLSALNKALLNINFTGVGNDNIQVALVISSLNPSSTGLTESGCRNVSVLKLDENLDSAEIVNKWWLWGSKVKSLSPMDAFRLDLVARSISNMPRVVEIAGHEIHQILKKIDVPPDGILQQNIFDASAINSIFKEILKGLMVRYAISINVNLNYCSDQLFALVFQKDVSIKDNVVKQLLRKSVFTNSFDIITSERDFIADGSPIMLAFLSKFGSQDSKKIFDQLNPLHCFYQLYVDVVNTILLSNVKGDPLEALLISWLQCRIAIAVKKGMKSIDMESLLGEKINVSIQLPTENNYILRHSSDVTSDDDLLQLLPKISDCVEVYAEKFNKQIVLSTVKPFIMHESIEGQNYDFMFAAMIDGEEKKAFVVFGDLKSADVSPTKRSSSKTLDFSQFEYVLKVAAHFKKLKKQKVKLSVAAKAMAEGNFVFVYITTYTNVSFGVEKYGKYMKNLVIMNEVSTQKIARNLLGFLLCSKSSSC
jgi:hypothetical protein